VRQIGAPDPRGVYVIPLNPCETLWFNSGSIALNGTALGGGIAGENEVLLYRSTSGGSVEVAVGDASDRGHEWWAVTAAGFDETVRGWAGEAMKAPNCTTGCSALDVYRYTDGVYVGNLLRYP
jgi:hypothetical protein